MEWSWNSVQHLSGSLLVNPNVALEKAEKTKKDRPRQVFTLGEHQQQRINPIHPTTSRPTLQKNELQKRVILHLPKMFPNMIHDP